MVTHLDANALVAISDAGHPLGRKVARWLAGGLDLHVSAIAWAEFVSGPRGGLPSTEARAARTMSSEILDVGQREAELAARLFNATGRRSRSLSDCLVAATAILASAPLATENQTDFAPFVPHGLVLA